MAETSNKTLPEESTERDTRLAEHAEDVRKMRQAKGLEGLVGGLQAVVINTEPQMHDRAVQEMLRTTGMDWREGYADANHKVTRLGTDVSADILIQTRLAGENPFYPLNLTPKSRFLPHTRLETFIFSTPDIEAYVGLQRDRGVRFMTEDIQYHPDYAFIQTQPSPYTHNSLGFIQWSPHSGGSFKTREAQEFAVTAEKPDLPHLYNIGALDHCATRVTAAERDNAILEFMELTNYNFEFAIHVHSLNSITNVARLSKKDFAMVFTSGIASESAAQDIGPTEQFIANYGRRVHHMAFATKEIETTYDALERDGMRFLVELVGSEAEGLQQTFTTPSKYTLLVNEYIQRYGGFDGFFTQSNVTTLTDATSQQ